MTRLFAILVAFGAIASCATAPDTATSPDPLASCSLEDEPACVAYAEQATVASETPFGNLVVGLSARAAQLDGPDAVPYHQRIVELVETSDAVEPAVAKRAAPSFVVVGALVAQTLRDFSWDDETAMRLDARMERIRDDQQRIRQLATFVVNNGDPPSQAEAAWLIVYAYERHAELLRQVEVPEELTAPTRVAFRERLTELSSSLDAEAAKFRGGLRKHCRERDLSLTVCAQAAER